MKKKNNDWLWAFGVAGACALLLLRKREKGVGRLNVWKEIAQTEPLFFKKTYKKLNETEKSILENRANNNDFVPSSRSAKSAGEQFFNKMKRAVKSISGTNLPYEESVIYNADGDEIMRHRQYPNDDELIDYFLKRNYLTSFEKKIIEIVLNGKKIKDDKKIIKIKNLLVSKKGELSLADDEVDLINFLNEIKTRKEAKEWLIDYIKSTYGEVRDVQEVEVKNDIKVENKPAEIQSEEDVEKLMYFDIAKVALSIFEKLELFGEFSAQQINKHIEKEAPNLDELKEDYEFQRGTFKAKIRGYKIFLILSNIEKNAPIKKNEKVFFIKDYEEKANSIFEFSLTDKQQNVLKLSPLREFLYDNGVLYAWNRNFEAYHFVFLENNFYSYHFSINKKISKKYKKFYIIKENDDEMQLYGDNDKIAICQNLKTENLLWLESINYDYVFELEKLKDIFKKIIKKTNEKNYIKFIFEKDNDFIIIEELDYYDEKVIQSFPIKINKIINENMKIKLWQEAIKYLYDNDINNTIIYYCVEKNLLIFDKENEKIMIGCKFEK